MPKIVFRVFYSFKKYISHWWASHNKKGFGIHSPFVFKLVTKIIHDYTLFYCFADIEKERIRLINDNTLVEVSDLGAGSRVAKSSQRKISQIAKYSLKPAKQAQLLFRLINYFEFSNMLELGTSLGITTSYLSKTNSQSRVISLEGCPQIAQQAKQTLKNLQINNTTIIEGAFEETLPQAIAEFEKLDFVFFDGNHTKQATLEYFELCLPKINNDTLFVFDDIYWNQEMTEAWKSIKSHAKVVVTIDLFHLGLVFFRNELHPQHFKVRF